MRSFGLARLLAPLLAFAVLWWAQPETVAPLLQARFPVNLGSADQPHELFVPAAAILLVSLALRFGLPLILRLALLLPYAAAALSHGVGPRGPTFDPTRDLPGDSFAPGSRDDIAVDRAIAAALAARNGAPAEPRAQPSAFAKAAPHSPAAARAPMWPFGRSDAAA